MNKRLNTCSILSEIALIITFAIFFSSCGNTAKDEVETISINPTTLYGAWQTTTQIGDDDVTVVQIFADGFFSSAYYTSDPNTFVGTIGGRWSISADTLTKMYEFNTFDSTLVNQSEAFKLNLSVDSLSFNVNKEKWTLIDDGYPGILKGAWLMAGRKSDGRILRRDEGPRKTMKILSGTRFQWIAYHTETTKFSGSGGGTYTTSNGKYVENIAFFSRDSSRVGASLNFTFELVDDEWHHIGLSSKGDPIHEVWAHRE